MTCPWTDATRAGGCAVKLKLDELHLQTATAAREAKDVRAMLDGIA
jgi:hypothetical protein